MCVQVIIFVELFLLLLLLLLLLLRFFLPFLLTQGCHIQLKEVLLVTSLLKGCLAGNKDQLVSMQPVMMGRSNTISNLS